MPDNSSNENDKALRKKLMSYVFAACVIIVFYFLLRNARSVGNAISTVKTVFQPIVMGFIMAFLMNPIMMFFEKRLKKLFKKFIKNDGRAQIINRSVSTILSLLVLVGVVAIYNKQLLYQI